MGVARLRAQRRPGTALRLSCPRPLGPGARPRCNPSKLLLDPYARAIDGNVAWDEAVFPYPFRGDDQSRPNEPTARRSCRKSIVIDPHFDWGNDRPLRHPLDDTIIYEITRQGLHACGTPTCREAIRGTYAGLAHRGDHRLPARLGVTAVELLPVHQFIHDYAPRRAGPPQLLGLQLDRLLRAAPRVLVAAGRAGQQVQEFKWMVKALHAAGIEVILDVVYNHTAEGNHLGPDALVQGNRQPAYYRLVRGRPALLLRLHRNRQQPEHAPPARAAAASWIRCATGCTEMHVDGFRFDLASTLARELHEVDRLSAVLRPHPSGPGGQSA